MSVMQFKTNIRCGGCKVKVGNLLNQEDGIKHWDVDLSDPDRKLTVETEGIGAERVIELVKNAGYTATLI